MASIRMVWFDFGGVLSPPIQELFELFFKKTGIPPDALTHAMQ